MVWCSNSLIHGNAGIGAVELTGLCIVGLNLCAVVRWHVAASIVGVALQSGHVRVHGLPFGHVILLHLQDDCFDAIVQGVNSVESGLLQCVADFILLDIGLKS